MMLMSHPVRQGKLEKYTPSPASTVQQAAFRDVLRQFRRNSGLTQEELAQAARVSPRTVSALERGVNRAPRRDTLALLVSALHLEADERAVIELAARRARHQRSREVGFPGEAAATQFFIPTLYSGCSLCTQLGPQADKFGIILVFASRVLPA